MSEAIVTGVSDVHNRVDGRGRLCMYCGATAFTTAEIKAFDRWHPWTQPCRSREVAAK